MLQYYFKKLTFYFTMMWEFWYGEKSKCSRSDTANFHCTVKLGAGGIMVRVWRFKSGGICLTDRIMDQFVYMIISKANLKESAPPQKNWIQRKIDKKTMIISGLC